jgi:hydroxymethylpyrimidine pyrophosphatase-like HAD family hydrolase
MSSTINTNNILDVYKLCKQLIHNNEYILLYIDIDDTILSSEIGIRIIDPNIKLLIELIYDYKHDNLLFLTAREHEYKDKTIQELNRANLLPKEKYINYNVICSPYDKDFNPTKGNTMQQHINKFHTKTPPKWIIFVDDDIDQINDVSNYLKYTSFNYTLFHYQPKRYICWHIC